MAPMNEVTRVRQLSALSKFWRTRVLPCPGRVKVRSGQGVSASDIVAEMDQVLEYMLIKVDRLLGVSPKKADELIQCKPGDRLSKGDLIAGSVGIGRRSIRARQPCQIILAGDGQVLMEVSDHPFRLEAVFQGTITELIPDYGAVIESTGALLQGVWGNGRSGFGRAALVGNSPGDEISPEDLNISQRGAIICAGICARKDVLQQAEANSISGFIFGSLDIDLVPIAQSLQIPVILMEGFGKTAINRLAFEQIGNALNQEIALDAKHWDIWGGSRPELFIPKSGVVAAAEPELFHHYLPGMLVRFVRSEYRGCLGTITGIHMRTGSMYASNLPVAEIKLQDSKIVQTDLANLEVLRVD